MKKAISSREKEFGLDILLPSSIFLERRLSFLESIVVYLKEVRKLTYSEIATRTNRDERNIWTLYNRAAKKLGTADFSVRTDVPFIFIPLSVVRDRSLSIMESVVYHLKQTTSLRNSEIALLLGRSSKTIWTVYNRARKKKND